MGAASEFDSAFRSMTKDRAEALIVLPDAFFLSQVRRIAEFAAQHRLPTMYWTLEALNPADQQQYRLPTAVDAPGTLQGPVTAMIDLAESLAM